MGSYTSVGRGGPVLIPGEGGIRGLILVLGEGDIQGLIHILGDIPGLIPVLDPGICNFEAQHVNLEI